MVRGCPGVRWGLWGIFLRCRCGIKGSLPAVFTACLTNYVDYQHVMQIFFTLLACSHHLWARGDVGARGAGVRINSSTPRK